MRIALAQLDPTVADLGGNARKLEAAYSRAVTAGAELVVFSELALIGYPPLDLLGRDEFLAAAGRELHALAARLGPVPALVGCVLPTPGSGGRPIQNCAALLQGGRLVAAQAKTRLPTYDVFDEDRYFEPAEARRPLEIAGRRVGVTVCEDIWEGPHEGRRRYAAEPVAELVAQGAELIVNLSASPFHAGRGREREEHLGGIARRVGRPVLLVNQVGGDDSLLFDGRSLCVGPDGALWARAAAFREDLVLVDTQAGRGEIGPPPPEGPAELHAALVMGLQGYLRKCNFREVVFGLSGGVDSALVAALAADALGGERVRCLAMPSRYSAAMSLEDAALLARRLGARFQVLPIDGPQAALLQALEPALGDVRLTLTEENVQARVRGTLVMAVSNQTGALALATGNKSELACGYCTLYGDMAGGLAPIGDLWKHQVYALARFANRAGEVIPERILTRPPSAELRPDQTDQDSLPPYAELDAVLELTITQGLDRAAILAQGHAPALVERVLRLVELSEHKRRQAAPVLRVTRRAFGAGRQIPLARALSKG
jgi:NAD+ synthase (glutamine-hydrolysing)